MYLFSLLCFLTWKWKFTAPCRYKDQSKVLKCTRAHSKGNPAIQLYLGPSIIQYGANLHVPDVTNCMPAGLHNYMSSETSLMWRGTCTTLTCIIQAIPANCCTSESSCMCTPQTNEERWNILCIGPSSCTPNIVSWISCNLKQQFSTQIFSIVCPEYL